MPQLFVTMMSLLYLTGTVGFLWMLYRVEVTPESVWEPLLMVFFVFCLVWAASATLLYMLRSIIPAWKDHRYGASLRQGFFLGVLVALHAVLQAFLLWNIFSAIILTLVVILLEYTFMRLQT
jgi:hypothetical protein